METDMDFPILILGTGGMAKEICSWLKDMELPLAAFYDPEGTAPEVIHSLPVVRSLKGWRKSGFVIGVPDPKEKVRLAGQATEAGLRILDAILHPASLHGAMVLLSPGCLIGPFARISAGASIGDLTHVGTGALIGPEVAIGPFSQIGQGTSIGSGSYLGREVNLGDGSTVKWDKAIGDNVVIGPGSVVTKDIASGSNVSGNPARPIGIIGQVE